MKCAVAQPTYFPWAGYFSLIDQVDRFVFLDDVQYERGTWQNRNRVLANGEAHWLTVPAHREFLGQAINQVVVDDQANWRQKHFRLVSEAYARHPHASDMLAVARCILTSETKHLGELNITVITDIATKLGTRTKLLRSSELGVSGTRTERLIGICEALRCDEYLSPVGSSDYLAQDGFTAKTSIRLRFNEFAPVPYPQKGTAAFVSHLSVLDVLANLGWAGTAAYIRGGS